MESVDEIDAFIILSGTVERLFKNVGATLAAAVAMIDYALPEIMQGATDEDG